MSKLGQTQKIAEIGRIFAQKVANSSIVYELTLITPEHEICGYKWQLRWYQQICFMLVTFRKIDFSKGFFLANGRKKAYVMAHRPDGLIPSGRQVGGWDWTGGWAGLAPCIGVHTRKMCQKP